MEQTQRNMHGFSDRFTVCMYALILYVRQILYSQLHPLQPFQACFYADIQIIFVTVHWVQYIENCPKSNKNFCDITWNVVENMVLHEIFRVVSRFHATFHVISRKLDFFWDREVTVQVYSVHYTAIYCTVIDTSTRNLTEPTWMRVSWVMIRPRALLREALSRPLKGLIKSPAVFW